MLFILIPYIVAVLMPSWKWLGGYCAFGCLLAAFLYLDYTMHYTDVVSNIDAYIFQVFSLLSAIFGILGILVSVFCFSLEKKLNSSKWTFTVKVGVYCSGCCNSNFNYLISCIL